MIIWLHLYTKLNYKSIIVYTSVIILCCLHLYMGLQVNNLLNMFEINYMY